nr:MAG TPA: hypothetical protein [Caudoviricetes sp.]
MICIKDWNDFQSFLLKREQKSIRREQHYHIW